MEFVRIRRLLISSTIVILINLIGEGNSHGRLMNPPARNCMWRFGFPNPVNYNDNELFCGGYSVQQITNGGKCGVCGDDYRSPTPRAHETGGLYGNGVIVRRYFSGQDITVKVDLTSNHHGYFEFRLCPLKSSTEEATQACLNRYRLKVVDPSGSTYSKYKIMTDDRSGSFDISVRLPKGLTCNKCVFQWKYVTGNSWGVCDDGTEQMGCGPQENFVNCADVSIQSITNGKYWLDSELASSTRANPHMMYFKDFSKEGAPMTPFVIRHQVCISTEKYAVLPGIDSWCQSGCMRYPPHCPPNICRCVEDCKAIGNFSRLLGSDQWCLDNCSVYPLKNCAADKCLCW